MPVWQAAIGLSLPSSRRCHCCHNAAQNDWVWHSTIVTPETHRKMMAGARNSSRRQKHNPADCAGAMIAMERGAELHSTSTLLLVRNRPKELKENNNTVHTGKCPDTTHKGCVGAFACGRSNGQSSLSELKGGKVVESLSPMQRAIRCNVRHTLASTMPTTSSLLLVLYYTAMKEFMKATVLFEYPCLQSGCSGCNFSDQDS